MCSDSATPTENLLLELRNALGGGALTTTSKVLLSIKGKIIAVVFGD